MPDVLTMQQVADLAQVERPVVSMWRSRYAGSEDPFPAPVAEQRLTFSAESVANWLTRNGRGNNREAAEDAVLHSSRFSRVLAHPGDASRLLLLQTLTGESLAGFPHESLDQVIRELGFARTLHPKETLRALRHEELVDDVDALAEAGYSGEPVLWRMVEALRGASTPPNVFTDAALTADGATLFSAIIKALAPDRHLIVDGEGALAVLAQIVGGLRGSAFGGAATPESLHYVDSLGPTQRGEDPGGSPAQSESECKALGSLERCGIVRDVILRALAASGVDLARHEPEKAALNLVVEPVLRAEDAKDFFARVSTTGHALEAGDIALIVAPAEWLIDDITGEPQAHTARRECFNIDKATRAVDRHGQRQRAGDAPDYTLPLRYAATLPKGLLRSAGRRRLALWVLSRDGDEADAGFTRYGEHSNHPVNVGECDALAVDVAAVCSDDSVGHAYLRARRQARMALFKAPSLVIAPGHREPVDGGVALASVWEAERACGGRFTGVELSSTGIIAPRAPRSWNEITSVYASVRRGHRVSDALASSPQGVVVIGCDEVRGLRKVGSRHMDRLTLERAVPQARFTEPGDVVFTNVAAAAALVDERGGSLVQSPARILRAKPEGKDGARLVPTQAALDISAQRGTDTAGWHLHLTPLDQAEEVEKVAEAVAQRRKALHVQLAALDAYESQVMTSVAQGVLHADLSDAGDDVHDGQTRAGASGVAS